MDRYATWVMVWGGIAIAMRYAVPMARRTARSRRRRLRLLVGVCTLIVAALAGAAALTAKTQLRPITVHTTLIARLNEDGSAELFKFAAGVDEARTGPGNPVFLSGYIDQDGTRQMITDSDDARFIQIEALLRCTPSGWPVAYWVRSEVEVQGRRPGMYTESDRRASKEQVLIWVASADMPGWFFDADPRPAKERLARPPKPRPVSKEELLLTNLKEREGGRMTTIAAREGGLKHTVFWERVAALLLALVAVGITTNSLVAHRVIRLSVRVRARAIRRANHCRKCGYSLAGLQADKCPECGSLASRITEAPP